MEDPAGIGPLVDALRGAVRDGKSLDVAIRDLSPFVAPDLLAKAKELFLERAAQIRRLKIPAGFVDGGDEGWYQGAQGGDLFWPAMRGSLSERLSTSAVEEIDRASSRIVAYLPNPAQGKFQSRGLVLGYVQSGKTANYSAVIAKAVDAGYKLVIVLSGIHEALRVQTQRRLDLEIVRLTPQTMEKTLSLTSEDADFRMGSFQQPDAVLSGANDQRVLAVIKKNGSRLKKLITWAQRASPMTLGSCPALIIDDEADQASVNTASDVDPSTINRRIRDLLRGFPRAAYVGYTATPFANVLIGLHSADDDDLYPKDFIFDLPRSKSYFGAERIFGRDALPLDDAGTQFDGLDVIRTVPDEEVPGLQPRSAKTRENFAPVLTYTLRMATLYFWLATAARWHREGRVHSSMLIHTTMYVSVQNQLAPEISAFQAEVSKKLAERDPGIIAEVEAIWSDEVDRVPPPDGVVPVSFEEVLALLPEVLDGTQVVVENAQSVKRLSYLGEASPMVVIGGNVLSRGLTLEGLVVSYFIRAASTYDTLLQMGRWFGYRDGYEDLPRIWMTSELEGFFADMALVEQEIRYDIARYETEGMTPRQFGPRIRTHPALSITSPMKMRRAVDAEVSFSGQLIQTILFHHRDDAILRADLAAANTLAADAERALSTRARSVGGANLFAGVPAHVIEDFLWRYKFHENARTIASDTLVGYIKSQNVLGRLLNWNVAFIGRTDGRKRRFGDSVEIGALKRSKLAASDADTARLGVIASASDLVVDLSDRTAEEGAQALDRILERRAGVPLLLLYLIDKDSSPRKVGQRVPLEAADDLVGVALLFPRSADATPQKYKAAFLAETYFEEPEVEADPDDEVAA